MHKSNHELCCSCAGFRLAAAAVLAQESSVTGRVNLLRTSGSARSDDNAGIVVWLTPISSRPSSSHRRDPGARPRPKIVQQNKRFETRVLAIEVGSIVDFPNRDPFFHNVFSMFDGKRFDLGLYEAGATKACGSISRGLLHFLQHPFPDERRCRCGGHALFRDSVNSGRVSNCTDPSGPISARCLGGAHCAGSSEANFQASHNRGAINFAGGYSASGVPGPRSGTRQQVWKGLRISDFSQPRLCGAVMRISKPNHFRC